MKIFILFFLITTVHASELDKFSCSGKIKELSHEWKSSEKWIKHYQGGLKNFFLASPTSVVGEWVLVRSLPDGSVISKINQSGRIEAAFLGKDCSKDVKTYPHPAPEKNAKTDKDIATFVSDNKQGAIYIWSPRMTLSQKGIKEIKGAAKKLKLPLLVLMDKNVTDKELHSLRKKLGSIDTQKVDSLELRMREVEQHFPALLVFKDSKILPEVKYGFEKSDRFQLDLSRMLSSGK